MSAASAWEIATKVRIGNLPGAIEVAERLSAILADQSFQPLLIGIEHARRAGLIPGEHRDPFDRMLIAQAQIEALCLVSNEKCFDRFGIERLWQAGIPRSISAWCSSGRPRLPELVAWAGLQDG